MKDSLYFRSAYNDLMKNKGVNVALVVVLVLSSFLMATGSMVMERLVGSVNQLFDEAKPPHFLQMHKGDDDPDALARFAAAHPEIDAWLVEEMLGFDSAAIAWHRPATGGSGDLADSLIDNLFVTQNEEFDFLIDETGAIPRPSQGEVYVPVAYQQRFDLQAGDRLAIRTDNGFQDLRVQGFVRDAQMASSLSSATRFLVSGADFRELGRAGGGEPEIIAEYRLADPSLAADFQRAYESDEALPKNGQAVTFQMIRIINAFSDGLVAVALVFVSLLLIAIALLNLRFVIRGTLEDEVREIGAMKAIGLPHKAIARLYLAKYRVMTFLACIVGGLLAVIATNLLTRGIQANYAEAPPSVTAILVPVLALGLVYLFVVAICRGVLRGVKKIQVVNALVHGSMLDERQTARRAERQARRVRKTSLASYRGGSISRRLAFLDLRAEGGQWVLIPIVFFLATVLMTLPMNLLSTFESPRFVTYMGAPESDLRADLQFSDDIDAVREDVLSSMQGDDRLTDVRAFANVLYETQGEGWEILRAEVGDYSGDTVEFLQGERPEPGQIALSVLNANKYQLSTGDKLTIRQGGESTAIVVSGIYQDVTRGGYTAKMQGEATTGAAGYVIYANAADGADPAAVAADYSERFPVATVIPMREYVQQTLSYVTGAFRSAAVLSFVFGVGVAVLITSLFLKLRLTRERRKMGVLSALGFSIGEIIAQVRGRTILSVAVGTLFGLVFAATAGESLVGLFISLAGLGISNLAFLPYPLLVYVAFPLILIAAGYFGAVVLTARLRSADKSGWLKG
ncbi:FtsX-like permease family protein [Streptosporangium soli]|nr:ABC transporter permease [Streptosporangium sp. KLBMP 9127]